MQLITVQLLTILLLMQVFVFSVLQSKDQYYRASLLFGLVTDDCIHMKHIYNI